MLTDHRDRERRNELSVNPVTDLSEIIENQLTALLLISGAAGEHEQLFRSPVLARSSRLRELIRLSCVLALRSPGDEAVRKDLVHAAVLHGEALFEGGYPDSYLFEELYRGRSAIWSHLVQQHGKTVRVIAEAMLRIDITLSLASQASLRGYHRTAFEQRGTWPHVIEELTNAWNPPPALIPRLTEAKKKSPDVCAMAEPKSSGQRHAHTKT
jgi:hypothetical protein